MDPEIDQSQSRDSLQGSVADSDRKPAESELNPPKDDSPRVSEDEVELRLAIITLKCLYNEEIEKHFKSYNFLQPEALSRIHRQVTATTFAHCQEKHPKLKMSPDHQQQMTEALAHIFKRYEEQNIQRLPNNSYAVGIDLGTTFSCAAVYINGKVEIIHNETGQRTTPSYVGFLEDGSIITGAEAKKEALKRPENVIYDAKRLIGRPFDDPKVKESMRLWPFKVVEKKGRPKYKTQSVREIVGPASKKRKISNKKYYPEEISAQVLKRMKSISENYLGTTVSNAVITVPATFNDSQRLATKVAATIAGFEKTTIINEPTAAAIAYSLHRLDDMERNVLIFDLGGGTFDVVVLKILKGDITVRAVNGDPHLGGEAFDETLMKYYADSFKERHQVDLLQTPKDRKDLLHNNICLRKLRNECEKRKKVLTTSSQTLLGLYAPNSRMKTLDHFFQISRQKFEELNMHLFNRCIHIVEETLEEANMVKSEINDVVLVGGSSRIPKIQQMLEEFFEGKALCKSMHPDESVAHGAAIHASVLNGQQAAGLHKITLKDVTPLPIGIKLHNGLMQTLIPKNSLLPIEVKCDRFQTFKDGETGIRIKIFQGEHPEALKNSLLGTFDLMGLPPKKAGEEKILISMQVSEEGVLNAKAYSGSNRAVANSEITCKAFKGQMTEEEIEEAKLHI